MNSINTLGECSAPAPLNLGVMPKNTPPNSMHYESIASLETYLKEVETKLLCKETRVSVSYPSTSITSWDGRTLASENATLLSNVSGVANLYAIFTAPKGVDTYTLRYIGKTTKKLARQRITNHLFRKDERTGSKLAQIVAHISAGGMIQIAWVGVEPESLRNYLEEELIRLHPEADWNRENREARLK